MRKHLLGWLAAVACPLVLWSPSWVHGQASGNVRAAGGLPPIRHVFVLMLENQNAAITFSNTPPAPYLARTLTAQGALLSNYYGIGHASLDNYIALISGQAPNEKTQLDCLLFSDFRLEQVGLDAHGQAIGIGCVYPAIVKTLPDQLEAAGFSWRGYMEDMGKNPRRETPTCGHPQVGARDHTLFATDSDKYAAKHNPFVYFHTIIDDQARCDAHVVNLEVLSEDLQSIGTTPNYVFITPNLCNDGHDPQCIDGTPGGYPAINAFLRAWVPRITASPAFKQDGLLILTFDESEGYGADGSSACCGEKPLANARRPPGVLGPGGGKIGAVLLSRFIKPGTVSTVPYNHYSLLRTVEDIFHLDHLGYAAEPELQSFGADVFTR
jgi:hypothetical protein